MELATVANAQRLTPRTLRQEAARLARRRRKGNAVKAAIYERYGPPEVVEVREVPTPVPKDDEVLVRIHATTVTSGDARLRAFNVPPVFWLPGRLYLGLTAPKHPILGSEFAGAVMAVGAKVARVKVGDPVFGFRVFGTHAEYVCLPETAPVIGKPATMTFEQAAAIPFGALTALFFLRKAGLTDGHRILIHGASGAVGCAAVQLARHLGAHVTGVCSTSGVDLVRSLGADAVIDYTREDFTQGDATYDIILDTVGTTRFGRCKRVLAPRGVHVFLVSGLIQLLQSLWTGFSGGQKVICGVSHDTIEDLVFLRDLIEVGALRAVIDREYPLEGIVDAHRYVDRGRKKGSVVITLGHAGEA